MQQQRSILDCGRQLLVAVFCMGPLSLAMAQTIYRTEEAGVTAFSDRPPAAGSYELMVLDTPPPAEDGLLEARLAAMRDTTDRMVRTRQERERHRAQLRALSQPVPTTVVDTSPQTLPPVAMGGYWPRIGGPLLPRPPLRPLPVVRPHVPPGWSLMAPGNAQLMRPLVSSRRP